MRAILLAGGQGTRLRPLTLNTPKPVVPIFDRPFLQYQIDVLRQVPDVDEIVLSLNYQPHRIQEVFGDGSAMGIRLLYEVEPEPLGTGGAIRFAAGDYRGAPLIVFNGDVFTSVDLVALLALHRERHAKATIVLTPVDNPSAYGLVETDRDGNVLAFVEKPKPEEIRCNTINAGIYVLEPDLLHRIPLGTPSSVERDYFPSLIRDKETFVAHVSDGYWLDIGTPSKYRQAHADIMTGRFKAAPFLKAPRNTVISPSASIAREAVIESPCFVGDGAVIGRGTRIGPHTVVGSGCRIGMNTRLDGTILWPGTHVGDEVHLGPIVAGRNCRIGAHASITGDGMLGDESVVTDYSRLGT
jgi:NDP-sugar pyrophosphorylase family protein